MLMACHEVLFQQWMMNLDEDMLIYKGLNTNVKSPNYPLTFPHHCFAGICYGATNTLIRAWSGGFGSTAGHAINIDSDSDTHWNFYVHTIVIGD